MQVHWHLSYIYIRKKTFKNKKRTLSPPRGNTRPLWSCPSWLSLGTWCLTGCWQNAKILAPLYLRLQWGSLSYCMSYTYSSKQILLKGIYFLQKKWTLTSASRSYTKLSCHCSSVLNGCFLAVSPYTGRLVFKRLIKELTCRLSKKLIALPVSSNQSAYICALTSFTSEQGLSGIVKFPVGNDRMVLSAKRNPCVSVLLPNPQVAH